MGMNKAPICVDDEMQLPWANRDNCEVARQCRAVIINRLEISRFEKRARSLFELPTQSIICRYRPFKTHGPKSIR